MDDGATRTTRTLQSARLELRPFAPSDAEEVHRLLDLDPGEPGMTMHERRAAVTFRGTQLAWQGGIGSHAVVLSATGAIVGYAGLQFVLLPTRPLATPELELFCGVGRAHRGNGYALEACTLLRDHAFGTLHLGRLISIAERGNPTAIHLMERLGAEIGPHPADADAVLGTLERPGDPPRG